MILPAVKSNYAGRCVFYWDKRCYATNARKVRKSLFHQFLNFSPQKYWYYVNNSNIDENQPAFQVNVFVFLLIGGIKCFTADSKVVLKWYLNRADQARNTKAIKESIYSSSEKYKPFHPFQILITENWLPK